jgi:3,4-dihydroxy 2-butanone 4-phosphate synthase/GTP cyclohydrolase II
LAEGRLNTQYGEFRTLAYSSKVDAGAHIALIKGDVRGQEGVLVRMHSHCLFGDVFGSAQCDCRRLIDESMRMIAAEGRGVLVYLHQGKPALGWTRAEAALDGSSCMTATCPITACRTAAGCCNMKLA